jgi:chemotaxis protein CheD
VTADKAMGRRSIEIGSNPDGIIVGVGEYAVAARPQTLITQALGSCVGVCLWDPRLRIGGMAHVMLPSAPASGYSGRPHRFADLAIPAMVEKLAAMGAKPRGLVAKIAGGSAMFKGDSGIDTIGGRNVEAVRTQLDNYGIKVKAADTGVSHARTIELMLDTGVLLVRSYTFGMREI